MASSLQSSPQRFLVFHSLYPTLCSVHADTFLVSCDDSKNRALSTFAGTVFRSSLHGKYRWTKTKKEFWAKCYLDVLRMALTVWEALLDTSLFIVYLSSTFCCRAYVAEIGMPGINASEHVSAIKEDWPFDRLRIPLLKTSAYLKRIRSFSLKNLCRFIKRRDILLSSSTESSQDGFCKRCFSFSLERR